MSYVPPLHAMQRRGFLLGAASAAFLSGRLSIARAADAEPAARLQPSDWIALERTLQGGRIILPGAKGYLELSRGYNATYENRRPVGIVWCTGAQDVAAAVNWCRARGIEPKIRGGGHSYAGFSMTDGVMIATGGITQGARVNPDGTVWLPGGLLNQDVYRLLRRHNVSLTHGRCVTVGLAGFLLGGGIGFSMRNWGVASDLLLATEIVLADGRRVTATPNGPDARLFWACTGGAGGNFGVNTAFRLKTMQVFGATVFQIRWGFRNGKERVVARTLLRDLTGADNRFGSRLSLKTRPAKPDETTVAIDLLGQYAGEPAYVEKLLAEAMRVDPPIHKAIQPMAYWDAQAFLSDEDTLDCFHERSAFLAGQLSDEALDQAYAFLEKFPGRSAGTHGDLRFFQTGGKVNKPDRESAFVHRQSEWLMDVAMSWSPAANVAEVEGCIDWQNAFFNRMWREGTGGAFQNFADPALQNPQRAYYRTALDQLSLVKKAYDPGNMFNYAQSIPVAV
jgi:FAD/FMN-containing dehydrogenase